MLKKRTSRLGDVEWVAAVWSEERVKAVLKGIDKYIKITIHNNNNHYQLLLEYMKWH